jgi:hypothetical protein
MSKKKTWGDNQNLAYEVWKHYHSIGGSDKERMIQIVTWLLGFSAAIIGFYASGKLTEPLATVLLIVIGLLISLLAAFVALLYGSYAAWNWSIADHIACDYEWTEQKPDYKPFESYWKEWLAKPCRDRIAPVFWVFFVVSLLSLIVHVILLSSCKSAGPLKVPNISKVKKVEVIARVMEQQKIVAEIDDKTNIEEIMSFISMNNQKWYTSWHAYPTPQARAIFRNAAGAPLLILWFGPNWIGGQDMPHGPTGAKLWKLEESKLKDLKKLLSIESV